MSAMRIRNVTVDAVLIQAVIAAALSFAHLHDLAVAAGQDGWKAWAYPVSVDLLLVAAWKRLRSGESKAAGWSWFLVALAASLGANVATAGLLDLDNVPAWLRIAVAGWPAVAFLGGTLLAHGPADRTAPVAEPYDAPTWKRCPSPLPSRPPSPRPPNPSPSLPAVQPTGFQPPSSTTPGRSPPSTTPAPGHPSTPPPFAPGSASRLNSPKPSPPNSPDPEGTRSCDRPPSARSSALPN